MAFNYHAPPGNFNRPPSSYGGYPGQHPLPVAPGMGPPPGSMPAPGTAGAPGMQQAQSPGGLPPNFDPRASMPNINFNAPVIRLGMSGQSNAPNSAFTDRRGGNAEPISNRRGLGLGYEGRSDQRRERETINVLLPQQTREEVARTIFIGNLTPAFGGDDNLFKILDIGGGLRRWTRAIDANQKPLTFGFAEYNDADNLAVAIEVLNDVQIKSKDQPKPKKEEPNTNGAKKEEDTAMVDVKNEVKEEQAEVNGTVKKEDGSGDETEAKPEEMDVDEPPKMDKLLVVIDDASQKYIDEWSGRKEQKSEQDAQSRQFHVDGSKQDLYQVLRTIENPSPYNAENGEGMQMNGERGQTQTITDAETGEVVEIPLTVEDELNDIPAEMRETVTKEIAAFRDRSHRRDLERLKQEEREEAEHMMKAASATAGGANNVPLGPRGNQGPPPTGPRAEAHVQIPKDYQNGVAFVNGTNTAESRLRREEEDSDASDEELERRRSAKRNAELEKLFLDQERKWINRERARTAAIARETDYEQREAQRIRTDSEMVRRRLAEWDDDKEARVRREEYYSNRDMWLKNREAFRAQEADMDERDRNLEEREKQLDQERRNREAGIADEFLAEQAKELEQQLQKPAQREPMKFKMGLGGAAKKEQQPPEAPRRTMAALEGLLEDDEDVAHRERSHRQLAPIADDKNKLPEEERQREARKLAREIPNDRKGLWSWDVKWEYVDVGALAQLREFAEKKVMEALGILEERQVDIVEDAIRNREKPQSLVDKIEPALHDEAEGFVKKLWRMLIFVSESEKRGIAAS